VKGRLLDIYHARGGDFTLLLTQYGNERLLYRLSVSPYAERFVLKGALLFVLWSPRPHRATRDIDLLGSGDNSSAELMRVFQDVCTVKCPDDGLEFHPDTVQVSAIGRQEEYLGQRVQLVTSLGKANIPLQVDVGFGDAMTLAPELVEYPTLLDFPAPWLRVYARETVVAEKLNAMVTLELTNSRIKDFYDLWVMARSFDFDGRTPSSAIRATFARRGTPFAVSPPVALTTDYSRNQDKVNLWKAFVRKNQLDVGQVELEGVVERVCSFLMPVLSALSEGHDLLAKWTAGGPWVPTRG
jgi:predicted nucleotidyltransferase component of viral defense system